MQNSSEGWENRRRFLRWLMASPLLAYSGLSYGSVGRLLASGGQDGQRAAETIEKVRQDADLITKPEQALNVMDFEAVARKTLPPAHFGAIVGGVDDDATVRANREGFSRIQIRARRLVDVQKIDMSVRLFGTAWDSPIILAPVGGQKAFHPDGEIAVAKAARSKGHLQILSTATSSSVEAVIAARGVPVWYQLYPTNVWNVTQALIKRAEAAGCPVLVLTVDVEGGHNRETAERFARMDSRNCDTCHGSAQNRQNGFLLRRKPMFEGLDVSDVTASDPKFMNWDFVKRLKDLTTMKFVIKGIVTRDDAQLAVENGVDGIIVSNHGGRGENSGRSTIESLPEVVEGAGGKIPVLVDGGFRRGTDVFKALALGAKGIAIGRPYIYGLAAFGQSGVETVLDILRRELQTIMRQAGTTSVDKITAAYLVDRSR